MDKLNPRFPYRMEKAKWYLMFLFMEQIISEDEFDDLYNRLPDEFKGHDTVDDVLLETQKAGYAP